MPERCHLELRYLLTLLHAPQLLAGGRTLRLHPHWTAETTTPHEIHLLPRWNPLLNRPATGLFKIRV
jgi:hypothetical protein